MKPIETLARTASPDGAELVLTRRDGEYRLVLDGQELMSSRCHGSEQVLAERACAELVGRRAPRVLIGGLGFGFTLRVALDGLPADARVVVGELFPLVVEAHQRWVGELAGRPTEDPRVTVVLGDVRRLLPSRQPFDAIILDVDNGPWAFTVTTNGELYSPAGLARLAASLVPGGVLSLWSSEPCPEFTARLARSGFEAWSERVESRSGRMGKGRIHTLFFGRRSGGRAGRGAASPLS